MTRGGDTAHFFVPNPKIAGYRLEYIFFTVGRQNKFEILEEKMNKIVKRYTE